MLDGTSVASSAFLSSPMDVASLSATEHREIGYLKSTSAPRIERYDIAAASWLPSLNLAGASGPATAFHIDDDGMYVAFGSSVYRYPLDGASRTLLLNASSAVQAIHSDGNVLFVNHSSGLYANIISINKQTNAQIASFNNYIDSVYGSSIAREVNRIFGRTSGVSPSDIAYVSYNDNGTFIGGGDSPYHGDYPGASRTWVFPGGAKVVDDSGTIYSTSGLTRLNSFGSTVRDIEFYGGNVPIVLSGNKLTAYSSGVLPTGSLTLGYTPSEIFVNSTHVITISPDATRPTGFRADLVPLSQLSPPTPGQPVNPVGLIYSPDKIETAADGSLLLYSKSHQSIFRWDPATQAYTQSIPLIGTAEFMAYSKVTNTAYLAYASGLIRQLDLSVPQPIEIPFAILPSAPLGLSTADSYVFAVDESGAWVSHYTFAPDGTLVDAVEWNYYSTEYVWSSTNQKMYFFRDDTSPNDLLWEEINANGTAYPAEPRGGIGLKQDSPLHGGAFSHPIRVSPDGSVVVLGSGSIHNATSLNLLTQTLGNSIKDATWLGSELYTIRNVGGVAEIQQWTGATYDLRRAVPKPGTAHSLVSVGIDRLLAITIGTNGIPVFTILDTQLQNVPTIDVTSLVTVNYSGRQFDRASQTYTFYATITNNGTTPLNQARIVLADLGPSGVTAANPDGVLSNGAPYFEMGSLTGQNTLIPGATSEARVIRVSAQPRVAYSFRTVVTALNTAASGSFTVQATDGSTTVSETRTTDTLQVVLNSRPNSNVVIRVTSGDATEHSVSPATLTFSPQNWSTPQTVTVTGVDDSVVDGNQRSFLTFAVDKPVSDPLFRESVSEIMAVVTLDNETVTSAVLEHREIGYFLVENNPRIERYDIAAATWLSPLALSNATGSATAFLVDDDGIYVAFGSSVFRYSLDGNSRTHLLNTASPVSAIHSDGNILFLNHSSGLYANVTSINKQTNAQIASFSNYVYSVFGSSISPETNRIIGRSQGVSPSDITFVSYNDNGTFTGGGDSPYHGNYPGASRTWVFPGGASVVDDSGTIYATSSLTRLNSFNATIRDIDYYGSNVPIVLSGNRLTAYSAAILAIGSTTLSYTPTEIFVNATHVITLTPDVTLTSGFRADLVALGLLNVPGQAIATDPDPDSDLEIEENSETVISEEWEAIDTSGIDTTQLEELPMDDFLDEPIDVSGSETDAFDENSLEAWTNKNAISVDEVFMDSIDWVDTSV